MMRTSGCFKRLSHGAVHLRTARHQLEREEKQQAKGQQQAQRQHIALFAAGQIFARQNPGGTSAREALPELALGGHVVRHEFVDELKERRRVVGGVLPAVAAEPVLWVEVLGAVGAVRGGEVCVAELML